MKTVEDIRQHAIDFLEKKGISFPRRDAEELIATTLGLTRLELYLDLERPLKDEELAKVKDLLKRRGKREPLQYLLGETKFYETILKLTPDVLIPRPETEILVDMIVKELREHDLEGKTLLDLGTGSGCIAISLKKALPQLNVLAIDISEKALQIAKENAERNNVEITFLKSDLFGSDCPKIDFIISNPPYIGEIEIESLEPEVLDFEPKVALFGGPQGFEIYERIAKEMKATLKPGGRAWLEIGYKQGAKLVEIFQNAGWKNTRFEKDWSGHDRFLIVL